MGLVLGSLSLSLTASTCLWADMKSGYWYEHKSAPRRGRDCNTMSILDLVFEQLTPKLPCGSWMVKMTLSPGLGVIYWCSPALSHPLLLSYDRAQPRPGICYSLRRTLLSGTQTVHRAPERHHELDRCVMCEWEMGREESWLVQHRLPKHCSAWSREGLWLRIWTVDGRYRATDNLLFDLAYS